MTGTGREFSGALVQALQETVQGEKAEKDLHVQCKDALKHKEVVGVNEFRLLVSSTLEEEILG